MHKHTRTHTYTHSLSPAGADQGGLQVPASFALSCPSPALLRRNGLAPAFSPFLSPMPHLSGSPFLSLILLPFPPRHPSPSLSLFILAFSSPTQYFSYHTYFSLPSHHSASARRRCYYTNLACTMSSRHCLRQQKGCALSIAASPNRPSRCA
jgi:hypothetical protein